MIEEKQQERIEQYLNGALSDDEIQELEREMQSDPAVAMEVDLHRKAGRVLEYALYKQEKKRLAQIEREIGDLGKKPVKLSWQYIARAAVILLIIGIGGWLWISAEYSQKALAHDYFATSELEVQRSETGALDMPYDEKLIVAEDLFKRERYAEAIAIYEDLAGIDSELAYKAQWNLMLAMMADGTCDNACLDQLTAIANDKNHPFTERASQLINKRNSRLFRLVN